MTEKEYVTEDVARTLKEKGFKEKCRGYYYNGLFSISCFYNEYNKQGVDCIVDAPSLAQAQRFLEEEYGIEVCTYPEYHEKDGGIVHRARIFDYCSLSFGDGIRGKLLPLWFEIKNQALNEGIKEALKII